MRSNWIPHPAQRTDTVVRPRLAATSRHIVEQKCRGARRRSHGARKKTLKQISQQAEAIRRFGELGITPPSLRRAWPMFLPSSSRKLSNFLHQCVAQIPTLRSVDQ